MALDSQESGPRRTRWGLVAMCATGLAIGAIGVGFGQYPNLLVNAGDTILLPNLEGDLVPYDQKEAGEFAYLMALGGLLMWAVGALIIRGKN